MQMNAGICKPVDRNSQKLSAAGAQTSSVILSIDESIALPHAGWVSPKDPANPSCC
jgi:hypothetical protein